MYILLCGHPPFEGENTEQIISLVKRGKMTMEGLVWLKVSENAKNLINNLICPENSRLSAAQVLKHPWFSEKLERATSQKSITEAIHHLKAFQTANKLKDAVMTFITSQFATIKETKQIRKTFLAMDKDGDGKISKNELIDQYKQSFGENEAENEVEKIMEQVDSDKSGFIDYTEFLKANIDISRLFSEKNLKSAFMLFDDDGSGKISSDKIKKVFAGEKNSDDKVWKEIVRSIYTNGDGEIDFDEFKALVTQNL